MAESLVSVKLERGGVMNGPVVGHKLLLLGDDDDDDDVDTSCVQLDHV